MTFTSFAVLLLLALLQAGDWLTTRTILALGGYEKNPIVAQLIARFGTDAALIGKGLVVVAIGAVLMLPPAPFNPLFLLILCAVYIWVVWQNWRVVQRLRSRDGGR